MSFIVIGTLASPPTLPIQGCISGGRSNVGQGHRDIQTGASGNPDAGRNLADVGARRLYMAVASLRLCGLGICTWRSMVGD